ncbi:nucleotidyl transferase AbiEii/AbiGii toxin family protein, partial [bacterium]|nr:nucleotidyl transferase AbiEii/AbiGii toxin family protein [bacterium]
SRRIAKLLVVDPPELIALKVIAYHKRHGTPKSGTDWRDLAMLLLTFPELKQNPGIVAERLKEAHAPKPVFDVWNELIKQRIRQQKDDE